MTAAQTSSRTALTATAALAGGGACVFDWDATHIYNPTWPGLAEFHNAQTTSMGAALALITATFTWAPGRWSRQRLDLTAGAVSSYWARQLSASAYPGTTMLDDPPRRFGPQTVVASACLAINAVAYAVGRRQHLEPLGSLGSPTAPSTLLDHAMASAQRSSSGTLRRTVGSGTRPHTGP